MDPADRGNNVRHPLELTCYEAEPGLVELRPAPRRRAWMDEATNAYRCLPLTIANTHGWQMLCPYAVRAVWRGGAETASVEIDTGGATPEGFAASHFGHGILTLNPLVIIRTPPHYNLWVSGPTNSFKDGIAPMSAVVETDWLPYTFSINWRFTRPDHPVVFEAGEPFCMFFPIERGVVGRCEPTLRSLGDDPALATSYKWARARRDLDGLLAQTRAEQFQGWYAAGERPEGGRADVEHETQVAPRPFKRDA